MAESAVRGGYNVVTLDYFGDRDQKELVQNYSLMRDFQLGFSAHALLVASRGLDFEAICYNSGLENHPEVVQKLAKGHILLGNSPSTLWRVRDWAHLRAVCQQENIPHPVTRLPGEEQPVGPSGPSVRLGLNRWLTKPARGGGGRGIYFWKGNALGEGRILQQWIPGRPGSAAFVADGQRCVLLGITEQLIGRRELGARGFTWCGNILPLSLPASKRDAVLREVREMAEKLTRAFGLRGVNGVDFVLSRNKAGPPVPYLMEVNPRYTASMELVEWAYGLNIFHLHIRSFDGELPSFSLEETIDQPGFCGKGIVYATRDTVMPETAGWRARNRRDIPFPGEKIGAHRPMCTVLAQGASRDDCWSRLLAAAEEVYRDSPDLVAGDARPA